MDQLTILACVVSLACCWAVMVRAKRACTVYFLGIKVNPEVYAEFVNQILHPRGTDYKAVQKEWREIWRGGGRVISMKRTN